MKHVFLRRLGCGLLALALMLCASACTKAPESAAGGSARLNLPVRSAAATEAPGNQEGAPEDAGSAGSGKTQGPRPGKTGKPNSTVYDDSLIGDAYSESGTAAGDYAYNVRVPELLSDSSDAVSLNAELMEFYGAAATGSAPDDIKYSIGWESHWDGSLLSLEMVIEPPGGSVYHELYYFDFETGTRLYTDDILKRMDLDWDKLEPMLIRAAVREHDRMMQAMDAEFTSGLIAEALAMRAQSALAAQDVWLPLYPNGDGTLTAFLNLATYAGAGWMQKACVIDPNEAATTLSASYEFITAEVDATGNVTVVYDAGGDVFTGDVYQRTYGFDFHKPYRIDGCFGKYAGLFIGNIGTGFDPYLFLLTENGTLEYVDLFRCARYGTYVCGGPVYGVHDITELYEGTAEMPDYGYAAVYALDASGAEHDLLKNVYLSDGLPRAMSGAFGSDDGGEWYELSLDDSGSIQAQYSAGDGYTNYYTGFPPRLGINRDGLVYALDLWDDAGHQHLSVCALMPGSGILVLTQITGDSVFDLVPGDVLYLFETYKGE